LYIPYSPPQRVDPALPVVRWPFFSLVLGHPGPCFISWFFFGVPPCPPFLRPVWQMVPFPPSATFGFRAPLAVCPFRACFFFCFFFFSGFGIQQPFWLLGTWCASPPPPAPPPGIISGFFFLPDIPLFSAPCFFSIPSPTSFPFPWFVSLTLRFASLWSLTLGRVFWHQFLVPLGLPQLPGGVTPPLTFFSVLSRFGREPFSPDSRHSI